MKLYLIFYFQTQFFTLIYVSIFMVVFFIYRNFKVKSILRKYAVVICLWICYLWICFGEECITMGSLPSVSMGGSGFASFKLQFLSIVFFS